MRREIVCKTSCMLIKHVPQRRVLSAFFACLPSESSPFPYPVFAFITHACVTRYTFTRLLIHAPMNT